MSIADDLYSILLLGAIAAAVAACAMMAYAGWQRSSEISQASILAMILTALALDISAFGVHWAYGHSVGSEESMTILQFLIEHPAFWIVPALCGAGLAFRPMIRD